MVELCVCHVDSFPLILNQMPEKNDNEKSVEVGDRTELVGINWSLGYLLRCYFLP